MTKKELEDKLKESDDKYLRLFAEFDNYKKRVAKEKLDIKNETKLSMVKSILDMDNDLTIAIKNIKDLETKEGVKLIANKLTNFLKTQGIEEIQTDVYDEDLHEVISMLGNNKKIIDVVSKGYIIEGKPFRYPKVVLG